MRGQAAGKIYRNPVLYLVGIGYLLVQAAITPVALVLPAMGRAFGVGVGESGWVQAAFLLALTALMLPSGRLGDLLGHRRIFAYGMALLALATAMGSFAPGLGWLVACRVLQGAGGAMVTGTSLAVIAQEFPVAHHGRTMGIVTMMSSLGSVVSVLLTGAFMDRLGWQAAFVILIPLAGLGAVAVIPFWRSRAGAGRVPVDLPGLVLLTLTVLGLFLTVSPVSAAALWDLFQPAMGAFTLAAGGALLWWERRAANPIFDVRHVWRGGYAAALGAHCTYHMSMMTTLFSIPFFVERVLSLPASRAVALVVPMQVCTTAMAFVGGWLYDRTRALWLRPASLLGISLGLAALGFLARDVSYGGLLGLLAFLGAVGGVFMAVNNTAVMASAGPGMHGFASGLLETVRQFSHGLAVPILAASLGSGTTAAAGSPDGTSFATGFRAAMLVMGSLVFVGVLLAAARRPTPGQATAESTAPILAAP